MGTKPVPYMGTKCGKSCHLTPHKSLSHFSALLDHCKSANLFTIFKSKPILENIRKISEHVSFLFPEKKFLVPETGGCKCHKSVKLGDRNIDPVLGTSLILAGPLCRAV